MTKCYRKQLYNVKQFNREKSVKLCFCNSGNSLRTCFRLCQLPIVTKILPLYHKIKFPCIAFHFTAAFSMFRFSFLQTPIYKHCMFIRYRISQVKSLLIVELKFSFPGGLRPFMTYSCNLHVRLSYGLWFIPRIL